MVRMLKKKSTYLNDVLLDLTQETDIKIVLITNMYMVWISHLTCSEIFTKNER